MQKNFLFCFNKIILCIVLAVSSLSLPAQSSTSAIKWKTNPFDHQVFILNNGQFDGDIPGNKKILYGAQLGSVWAYFTANGIVYRYAELPGNSKNEEEEESGETNPVFHYLKSTWDDASSLATVETSDELSYYYTYPKGSNSTIRTNVFRKLTYKNIYPGIDIEYSFLNGREGIEYTIIVHPGADLSLVKLNYTGANELKTTEYGDITFSSEMGTFTEHIPVSYYEAESDNIPVSQKINGNTESFSINKHYDKNKTLIIDPWISNPFFKGKDAAYRLDWDYQGNVYAYGGQSPYQLVKMNSMGAIEWVLTTTYTGADFGDFCIDKANGTGYYFQGLGSAVAVKINAAGALIKTYHGTGEFWKVKYDACNNDILVARGEGFQGGILDTNLLNMSSVYVLGPNSNPHNDMAMLAIDPNGKQCYFANCFLQDTANNNVFVQVPLPSLSPFTYPPAQDKLDFVERTTEYKTYNSNGYNGMAVSLKWLYLYNGDTLKRFNKNTGVLTSTYLSSKSAPFQWGGLDVDLCDNIFLGVQDSIYILNSTFKIVDRIRLGDIIYDLHLGQGNIMYACGQNYVYELINPVKSAFTISATPPNSCLVCNGSAEVNPSCSSGPFSYHWTNGATTQTATGLCAGIYTVTIWDSSSCPPRVDSAVVDIISKQGYAVSVRDTNPDCKRSTGNSTVYPTGGTAPYTYYWSNGATTQTTTGLSAGTYSCQITDNSGCIYFITTTIVNIPPPTITLYLGNYDTICTGSSITLTALGLSTYSWAPNSALSCTNCSSPIASPTVAITYTVTGVDTNGCSATTSTVSITVISLPPKLTITGKDSVCAGKRDTLLVRGDSTYYWYNQLSDSISYTGPVNSTTTYYAYSTNKYGCTDTTYYTIYVNYGPGITIQTKTLCENDPVQLQADATGSPPLSYLWSPGGETNSGIIVPDAGATYTVTVQDACSASASVTVVPYISPANACCDGVILLGDDTTLSASGMHKYEWEPSTGISCDTCPTVTVSPTVTTTYTVTGIDSNGCLVKRTVTIVVEIPCFNFIVPNVITPANPGPEGVNDEFYIETKNIDAWSITIYDRWGKEMFTTTNQYQYWKGTTESGKNVPDGVYYYIINATCQNTTYKKDGFVQLIR